MPRPIKGLKLFRRPDTGNLQIRGTIRCSDGRVLRVRQSPSTDDPALAEEEARQIERRLSGLHQPTWDTIQQKLETIWLLAQGGAANLPRIAELANDAMVLIPSGRSNVADGA